MAYNLEAYHDDPWVKNAEQRVRVQYGVAVSALKKSKALFKFGEHPGLTANTESSVWGYGNVLPFETLPTANVIDTVSSSSAADTQTITIEGHTVSGSGADAKYTFVAQTVTLTGQTQATLAIPLARCSRGYNSNGVELVGNIYIYEAGAAVAGVPSNTATVHNFISAGEQKTYKGATTFADGDYYFMTQFTASIRKAAAAAVDFNIEVMLPGGVFLPELRISTQSDAAPVILNFEPFLIIPANADIRITANSTANNTEIDCGFNGIIASVVT